MDKFTTTHRGYEIRCERDLFIAEPYKPDIYVFELASRRLDVLRAGIDAIWDAAQGFKAAPEWLLDWARAPRHCRINLTGFLATVIEGREIPATLQQELG